MFENIKKLFKKSNKKEALSSSSRDTAKERLHLVLMQDRANVSADFLDLMRQEIIEVIKKYIDIDESALDVRLKNQANEDGTQGAPVLYANIPILNIKDENKRMKKELNKEDSAKETEKKEDKSEKDQSEVSSEKEKKEDLSKTENKESSYKKVGDKEKTKDINQKSQKTNKTKEKIEAEVEEKERDKEVKIIEEKKQEDDKSEEEIEKQEDEKIEEAKKIVEEENRDIGNSESDKEE
ncbi:MAG: cell division topological specificity factor MinE [Clostridia bacterium]|nr:cell division topological specificity factor MinE [Clostridia bacterium]